MVQALFITSIPLLCMSSASSALHSFAKPFTNLVPGIEKLLSVRMQKQLPITCTSNRNTNMRPADLNMSLLQTTSPCACIQLRRWKKRRLAHTFTATILIIFLRFGQKQFVEQAYLSRANMRRESIQDWHWSEKNETLSDWKQLHRGTVFVLGETNTR